MTPAPAPSILVVVRADPRKTHRAVEALRIALGLSSGPNTVTVVLLDESPRLLTDDENLLDEVEDAEILQRHLPAIKELALPFIVPRGTRDRFALDAGYRVQEADTDAISRRLAAADRVLVF